MLQKWCIIFIAWLFQVSFLSAQSPADQVKIDSLQKVIDKAQHDTTVISALMEWNRIVFFYDAKTDSILRNKIDSIVKINLKKEQHKLVENKFLKAKAFVLNSKGIVLKNHGHTEKAIENYEEVIEIAKKIKDPHTQAQAINNIGIVHQQSSEYEKALRFFEQSLAIRKDINDEAGMASAYNNIGITYDELGNLSKAIEYYTECLKITEKIGSKVGQQACLSNIGTVYHTMGDSELAMNYYKRSLEIATELNYLSDMASSLSNIGIIYNDRGDYQKAIEYYRKSLKLEKEADDYWGQAITLSNIGNAYIALNNIDSAKYILEKSLGMHYELGDHQGIALILKNLGKIYIDEGNYKKAEQLLLESYDIAKKYKVQEELALTAQNLYILYKKTNRTSKALAMYEEYTELKDSLLSAKNQREVLRQEYNHEYEKRKAQDSVKAAAAKRVQKAILAEEKAKNERNKIRLKQTQLENKNQRLQSYFLFGFLGLALIFSFIVFNRFRLSKKQNQIIEKQKNEVQIQKEKVDKAYAQLEEKNTEILDSINYAKRIQNAILPRDKSIKELLPSSFVLYLPKDIVAGDFYWLEKVGTKTLIAAADCTGHGVPGAMVSVVCNNALNKSVREHQLSKPGDILTKTRELVLAEFQAGIQGIEKSDEEVKDGMDIALCSFEKVASITKLEYAGANNPLWVIRKDSSVIEEIKAHKQPIGKYTDPTAFPNHEIILNAGDSVYIFSDGYADQFGGPKGKKFKAANLKRLLLQNHSKPMKEQQKAIQLAFEEWKGTLEQLDDVCLIGVRV